MLPETLVQIHYHDRYGGVRQVMERYAAHFRALTGDTADTYLLCARSDSPMISGVTTIDIPKADYHHFFSKRVFTASAERLGRTLIRFLQSINAEQPVAVIGHNLCLGKNPALSEAFRHTAHMLGDSSGRSFRFFSVLHDFPFEGREPLLLNRTTDHRQEKFSVEKSLFSFDAPVHFIIPSSKVAPLTGLKGHEYSVVPDPFDFSGILSQYKKIPVEKMPTAVDNGVQSFRRELGRKASVQGLIIDHSLPLYCYPSRMIFRKNLFEALLLVGVILRGTLVTGGTGRSRRDRWRMNKACELSRRYGISFVPDVLSGVSPPQGGEPFGEIITASDRCISTSTAEGFGYSLFTPWYYGTQVIGRIPSGTALLAGMRMTGLYSRLPIPVDWISLDDTYQYLSEAYFRMFGKKYQTLRSFSAEVIIDETVDFSVLSECQQIRVLTHVLGNTSDRELWISRMRDTGKGWPGLSSLHTPCPSEISRNRNVVTAWYRNGFRNTFVNCLKGVPVCPSETDWYSSMEHHYADPACFRPYF